MRVGALGSSREVGKWPCGRPLSIRINNDRRFRFRVWFDGGLYFDGGFFVLTAGSLFFFDFQRLVSKVYQLVYLSE